VADPALARCEQLPGAYCSGKSPQPSTEEVVMTRALRPAAAVLAGAILAALLTSFPPGGQPEAKAALGPLQAVTLTGADFHPYEDGGDFHINGNYIRGSGYFVARIPFPAETVVITSVKYRVYDDQAAGDACVRLYRATPAEGSDVSWGERCTTGTSTTDPQTLTLPVFERVGRFHTAYFWVSLDGTNDTDLKLYGATVFYRVVI
jgi:hypothetical protein